MEEFYKQNVQNVKDYEGMQSLVEQQCIYNYIKLVHRIHFETESKELTNLKWNILGKDFNLLLPKMLQSTRVSNIWVNAYIKKNF